MYKCVQDDYASLVNSFVLSVYLISQINPNEYLMLWFTIEVFILHEDIPSFVDIFGKKSITN